MGESDYATLLRDNEALSDYLKVASLANLAHVHQTDEGEWNARGDPTEIAIQVFSTRFHVNRRDSIAGDNPNWKLLAEFPFDSDVKKMSVIYKNPHEDKMWAFTKGAVERVITSCSTYVSDPEKEPSEMTEDYQNQILENMEGLAKLGLRVLALASREYNEEYTEGEEIDRSKVENNLVFRGLIGLYDPPRPESAPSVKSCHEAGIEVHMLTGDHPGTARAIAGQVGILPAKMGELSKRVADGPSLKRSDVGIAMGQAGSDVAKDASDIILTDDNFASILAAIEEGRRTFDNIQKFVLHR